MKTDRLYALMLYLLNHGKTSASELAKRFEVSVRTIQRDMDSLCQARVPVVAETGVLGGYSLPEHFTMDRQTATPEDYRHMRTALHGLASATNDSAVSITLEKLSAMAEEEEDPIVLDFSVLREGDEQLLHTLKEAIRQKRRVTFHYTNADNIARQHTVEPVAVVYRWYAWYLLAYSNVKEDYRTYKLIRMRDASLTDEPFLRKHANARRILADIDQVDQRTNITLTLRCKPQVKTLVEEYLKARVMDAGGPDGCVMEATVVENERFWLGMLLSLGDAVEVLGPPALRSRVIDAAKGLLCLYREL